jgi:hypothetical protein
LTYSGNFRNKERGIVRVSIGVSIASLAVLAGCSLTVNVDRVQCNTDSDCTKRGRAFAGSICEDSLCEKAHQAIEAGVEDKTWSCLDAPPVTSTATGPFHVTLHLTDIVSSTPLSGVTANLCRKLDVACTDPEGPAVVSDANGLVAFDVPAAFTGYVSLQEGTTIMPGLYFFNPAVNSDLDVPAIQLASPAIASALIAGLGAKEDSADGIMLLSVVDCTGTNAANVTMSFTQSADAGASVSFYSVGGLPNAMVTMTDTSGYGGAVNVAPGTVAVTAKRSDGRAIGTYSLLVNPGAITYSKLVPVGQ